ncbi:hypothetical protein [Pseudoxanthomonas spadix]|jgi:hypothetical protein|uniref:hypothetical protein n=1 Tax=Pseudoxanthomonas spadix TaxID=415229 RepID=UPI001EE674A7|nr:hypothetical protein [Pseudoxanthomonas spadix]
MSSRHTQALMQINCAVFDADGLRQITAAISHARMPDVSANPTRRRCGSASFPA